jgi:antitoxin component of MazEF toxin-antitoxin module
MIINFGTRRLQKGGTSYVLPIPPYWINSVGVGKGSVLNVETNEDNSLRIFPITRDAQRQA